MKKSFSFIVGGCFIAISILSFLFGGLINPVTAIRAVSKHTHQIHATRGHIQRGWQPFPRCPKLRVISCTLWLRVLCDDKPRRSTFQIWNVIFGILIIMLQFGKLKWIITRFGFLGHWFGRALFYLFCGESPHSPCVLVGLFRKSCSNYSLLRHAHRVATQRALVPGTNILLIDPNGGFCIWCFFTWVIGGMCMFVGLVELIFGCRCECMPRLNSRPGPSEIRRHFPLP